MELVIEILILIVTPVIIPLIFLIIAGELKYNEKIKSKFIDILL